jgi:hypothetical protein
VVLFDDESVTYLDNGQEDIAGCSSAYSLLYVKWSYLGQHGCLPILARIMKQTTKEATDGFSQEEQLQHVES